MAFTTYDIRRPLAFNLHIAHGESIDNVAVIAEAGRPLVVYYMAIATTEESAVTVGIGIDESNPANLCVIEVPALSGVGTVPPVPVFESLAETLMSGFVLPADNELCVTLDAEPAEGKVVDVFVLCGEA